MAEVKAALFALDASFDGLLFPDQILSSSFPLHLPIGCSSRPSRPSDALAVILALPIFLECDALRLHFLLLRLQYCLYINYIILLKLLIRPVEPLFPLIQVEYFINQRHELQLVRHQNHALVLQYPTNAVVEDIIRHVRIYSTQWIVKEIDISLRVDRSC